MVCFMGCLWIWYYTGSLYDLVLLNETSSISMFIVLCVLVGAMGKSAQILFHVWLADAMEGPTPVSTLIHAATLVTTGIYLMVRLAFYDRFRLSNFSWLFNRIYGRCIRLFKQILNVLLLLALAANVYDGLELRGNTARKPNAHLMTHASLKPLYS
jgi:NADH:ubiquinone oxidoreductase subunit 5 (subunit L)/multisubunit Na+/H+ antiporter MnhA subunit